MWEPDEGSGVHRTASARRDRRDPARAPERSDGRWPVALVKSKSAADWLPAGWSLVFRGSGGALFDTSSPNAARKQGHRGSMLWLIRS